MSAEFDYSAPAELFFNSVKRHPKVGYRRFATAAEAIAFAVEGIGRGTITSVTLEVDEQRFDRNGVRRLFDAPGFPGLRRPVAA
jgi:hypothetical protein